MTPLNALIEEYEQGAWIADCEFSDAPNGSFELGSETWTGTVLSTRYEGGRHLTRIVGGKGGLGKPVTDRQYTEAISVGKIFSDILIFGSETAGQTLSDRVINYDRMAGTVGQALEQLCLTFSLTWRAGRDGKINLLKPSDGQTVAEKSYVRVGADIDGSAFLMVQDSSTIQIGALVEGKRVRAIRWCLNKSRLVAEVSYDPVFVQDLKGRLDFLKTYSAKVSKQNSDGSVDVIAAGRFALSKVPLLVGIPAAKITMLEGDLVNLGFYEGDPRRSYAVPTNQGQGSNAVARVGDTVDCGTLVLGTLTTNAAVGSPVSLGFQYVEPGPAHDAQVAQALITLGSFSPQAIALKAVITSGQDRVKL